MSAEKPEKASFSITLDLESALNHRQRSILLNSARSCEVSKLLAADIVVDLSIA